MVLDNGDESGSDTIESQLERARRSRASRSSSPDNISVSKRLKCESDNDVMIISPNFQTSRRPIPSDSDDDHMAISSKAPQEGSMQYSGNDSDDDHMAGISKTPQEGSIQDSGNDSDDESADLLYNIAQDCLQDDVNFCNFKNDYFKCYRNSLLWVLLSCDMLLGKIREHKKKTFLPPYSEFDDFLLQLYDKCQTKETIIIDKEFSNSNCLKVNATVILQGTETVSSYTEQSPTEYQEEIFKQCGNTTQVTKELMSHRILNSIETKNCDGTVTWRTAVHKNFTFSKSCKVVEERCFNNTSKFNIEASGMDMDAVATEIHIAMKLPDIWCLDAANGESPVFKHQFTLSTPQTDGEALLSRGVYQIIGCVSHSERQSHYVAYIFKNNKWVCMVCFSTFYSKF